ncbi:MAG: 4-deoxy-4-formamido-L-arabinose-phospho-UDP deformylase [Comamonadaceae bacterium SCN 68-20]|nr:MAG: 4-deoxy-4-formamido-L-arabinose-phospho-UDP deformylase [Comamonadaceae bacterium SCN 68-20]
MNTIAKSVNESAACGGGSCCGARDEGVAQASGPGTSTFRIPTMDCASEEGEIRRALEALPGLRGLRFQLGARTLTIDADAEHLPRALEAIRKAGFDPQPLAETRGAAEQVDEGRDHAHAHDDHHHGFGPGIGRLGTALGLAIAAEAVSFFLPPSMGWKLAGMAVAIVAIGLSGLDTYKKGLAALRQRRLNINALMSVAVTGAFVIGQWPEAAMVMALYAIAELIESRAVDRARNAIKGLMALAPETAEALQANGTWQSVPAKTIAPGATVRVKPGERVPLDGVVTAGRSAIDQAPVTGESIPVDKTPGDLVFAGTINQTGALELRVTAAADDSTLARIIHAVEQAQGARAPTQRFVDRFAAIYTPAVFAIALAVAVLMPLLTGLPWLQAAYKALVLLVIACPCALVISTPVTVVSGLAAAARKGILIKGGTYLEQARRIKAVALDKTGTLTEGKPRLVHWEALSNSDPVAVGASLAARSDHPVSKAIAEGLPGQRLEVIDFEALAGRGVQGQVEGQRYVLGNHRFVHDRGLCSDELEARLAEHEASGRTVTLLATDDRVLALFAVADTLKPSSADAVAELEALDVTPVMLTGDNASTARAIAAKAGVTDARGDLLPEDKLAAIADLQRAHGTTAMVGDGINDAPSLAKSDIGFAMGGAGTHVAMEAADIVIMTDDLRRVATTIRLSRRTHAVLWQNISLALGIKAVFLVLAVFANATMWMAVFADMGASLLVVANGLRLLRQPGQA